MTSPLRSRRVIVAGAAGLAVVLAILAVVLTVAARRLEPALHAAVVRALEERFDATVTLERLTVRWWPLLAIDGQGLEIRYQGRTDIPPLVAVRQFSGRTDLAGAWARRVREVTLDGFEVTIPPRRRHEMPGFGADDDRASPARAAGDGRATSLIGRVTAANLRLTVMPREAGKTPKVFDIYELLLTDVGLDTPAGFEALLTIPTPRGSIAAEGRFGPWFRSEPSLTPVAGRFTFDADLGSIRGIAGALASEGSFDGVIERITARGSTRTPDFHLPGLADAPVPLETTFDAVVDGTNGDVFLTAVHALLGGSAFDVSGAIARDADAGGRRVALDVTAAEARVDDVLRLIVDNEPVLLGTMEIDARLDIAPGPADVIDKLWADGRFALRQARFQSQTVQDRIDELSRRAQGRPGDDAVDDVVSNMAGRFSLKESVLTLPLVDFAVTGARVQMAGTYGLRSGELAFRGDVQMEAPVSQMVTGVRSWLLRPFDPLLSKHGAGTRVAIRVDGHRSDPSFGVEVGRTLRGQ